MTKREEFNSRVKPKYAKTHVPQCKRCMFFYPWGNDTMEIHHIVPLCDGGSNEEDNLVTLCKDCHKEWHMYFDEKIPFTSWMQRTPAKVYGAASLIQDENARAKYLSEIDTAWAFVRENRMIAQPYKDDKCKAYTEAHCGDWVDW